MSVDGIIDIATGQDNWWGCALEIQSGAEDLSNLKNGYLHFEIKGNTTSQFSIGFQTGSFAKGNQVNNFVTFAPGKNYSLESEWISFSIPVAELNKGADMANVTGILVLKGLKGFDGKHIHLRNIYYSQK